MYSIPTLKVLKPAWHTTFQDSGRYGYRHLGIPVSGAMDTQSFLFVNQRLGNDVHLPVIEMYGAGASFEVLTDTELCFGGATVDVELNGKSTENTALSVQKGDVINIKKYSLGHRLYLGVRHGWSVSTILNSASSLAESSLLPIKKGDILHTLPSSKTEVNKTNSLFIPIKIDLSAPLICHKGPEYNILSTVGMKSLESGSFSITPNNNRMGYRLAGPSIDIVGEMKDMLTSAVQPGTVQLLPSGDLIVLMRECQTTGGYPRLLQMKEASINQLAQRSTNDPVRFVVE